MTADGNTESQTRKIKNTKEKLQQLTISYEVVEWDRERFNAIDSEITDNIFLQLCKFFFTKFRQVIIAKWIQSKDYTTMMSLN